MGDEEHPDGCAVVLCNGTGEGKKRMEVGSVRISLPFPLFPSPISFH